jgi:hypothetical protein
MSFPFWLVLKGVTVPLKNWVNGVRLTSLFPHETVSGSSAEKDPLISPVIQLEMVSDQADFCSSFRLSSWLGNPGGLNLGIVEAWKSLMVLDQKELKVE